MSSITLFLLACFTTQIEKKGKLCADGDSDACGSLVDEQEKRSETETSIWVELDSVLSEGESIAVAGAMVDISARRNFAKDDALCVKGDDASCLRVASCLSSAEISGCEVDDQRAASLFNRLCSAGEIDSQTRHWGCVGWADHLREGRGTPKDNKAAFKIYEQACADTAASGLSCLYTAWSRFDVSDQSRVQESFQAAERGCTLGSAKACTFAGCAIAAGADSGVKQEEFHKRACEIVGPQTTECGFVDDHPTICAGTMVMGFPPPKGHGWPDETQPQEP